MKVLIATHNPGKFREICEIWSDMGWEFVGLRELGISEEAPEHEDTYLGNALSKARFYAQRSGLAVLADDSGLSVNALPGMLGVLTRRFGAGAQASDEDWLSFFLREMEKVDDRGARFVCAAVFIDSDGNEFTAQEHVDGVILEAPQAPIEPGIPLSSVFVPAGEDRVFSAMDAQEKNRYSHRGRAFSALKSVLSKS